MKNLLKQIETMLDNGDIVGAIESEIERLNNEKTQKEVELINAKKENKKMFIITIISLIVTILSIIVTLTSLFQ
ncbi:MAG: hypothetical protein AB1Z23_04320 [Eubacteriales bacterium]